MTSTTDTKAQELARELRQRGYLVPTAVLEEAMKEAKVQHVTIDLAGAMEKITPEMMDQAKDMMIEALTRRCSELEFAQRPVPHLAEIEEGSTQGLWGQFSPNHGPWKTEATQAFRDKKFSQIDTSHHVSTVRDDGTPYRVAEFHHAADAAFVEALVNAYRAGHLVPLEITEQTASLVREALIEEIGSDTYDCIRVWEAWGYGTMGESDFEVLVDDEERVADLVEAVMQAILNPAVATDAEVAAALDELEGVTPTGAVIDPDTLPGQANDPDKRPMDCRERQREEGRSYPRSGCPACGASIATGLKCRHG
ncbi:hypothetical protein MAL1_00223 [Bacteriophage DSS3_MAL1]|nr:hypothetical protein MAL1_00223 [Bacteriophage DSS3_MAL1]